MGSLRVVDHKQGSPEWVAWRLGVLGASRAAAIIGECKWSTAYQVWCEYTGRGKAFEGNSATERGNEIEPAARAAYEMHLGFIDAPPICLLHPEVDFIGCSLDGLNRATMVPLQIKYASEASHQMAIQGIVPRHYWIQLQHELMCVPEAPYHHYWSYREGNPALVQVEPDKEFQAKLLTAEIAFWDLVKSDVPPPLSEDDAKIVDLPEVNELCMKLLVIKDRTDRASKAAADRLKAKIIEIGGHNRIRCKNVLVSKSITKTGKDSFRLTVAREIA